MSQHHFLPLDRRAERNELLIHQCGPRQHNAYLYFGRCGLMIAPPGQPMPNRSQVTSTNYLLLPKSRVGQKSSLFVSSRVHMHNKCCVFCKMTLWRRQRRSHTYFGLYTRGRNRYCIDAVVCAGERKREKGGKGRIGGILRLRATECCIGELMLDSLTYV